MELEMVSAEEMAAINAALYAAENRRQVSPLGDHASAFHARTPSRADTQPGDKARGKTSHNTSNANQGCTWQSQDRSGNPSRESATMHHAQYRERAASSHCSLDVSSSENPFVKQARSLSNFTHTNTPNPHHSISNHCQSRPSSVFHQAQHRSQPSPLTRHRGEVASTNGLHRHEHLQQRPELAPHQRQQPSGLHPPGHPQQNLHSHRAQLYVAVPTQKSASGGQGAPSDGAGTPKNNDHLSNHTYGSDSMYAHSNNINNINSSNEPMHAARNNNISSINHNVSDAMSDHSSNHDINYSICSNNSSRNSNSIFIHPHNSRILDSFKAHHKHRDPQHSPEYSHQDHHQGPPSVPDSGQTRISEDSTCPPGPLPPRNNSHHHHHPDPRTLQGPGAHPREKLVVRLKILPLRRVAIMVPFNMHVVAACKSVAERDYDPKLKAWTVPFARVGEAAAALRRLSQVDVTVEPLHKLTQRALELRVDDDSAEYVSVPADLDAQMFPFQREGVRFGLQQGGRVLLGDEMGLGKTVQALALLACYRDEWPCLVVVPTSLRAQWAAALQQWLGIPEHNIKVVFKASAACQLDGLFNVVSYNFMAKLGDELKRRQFKVVVADESHFLKDPKSQRSQATVPFLKAARRAICITGTPALSRPSELFQQLHAVRPVLFKSFKEFAERYCQGGRFGYTGCSNAEELNALLNSMVMIRRMKRSVLSQLPAKQRQQVMLACEHLPGFSRIKDLMTKLAELDMIVKMDNEGSTDAKMKSKLLINELYMQSAEMKVPAVLEYIQMLLEADTAAKFLFFAHHKSLLEAVDQMMKKHKLKSIRIDGGTPADKRHGMVTAFQENADVRLAILSINAAGAGLTLTAASTVVFGELCWTPGDLVQAEDRAHRIGQQNCVNVHYLHAKGTVDDIIWRSVASKLDNLGQVLNGCEEGLNAGTVHAQPRGQRTLDMFMTPSQSRLDAPSTQTHPLIPSTATTASFRNVGLTDDECFVDSPSKRLRASTNPNVPLDHTIQQWARHP